jgi:Xaa-Pro aminopeptidase
MIEVHAIALAAALIQTPAVQSPVAALTVTPSHPLGTLRQQAALQQEWLRYRLDSVLPGLMRQNGVRMWIIPMREYNEDPVFFSLVSATTFFARRRTIYVFNDPGDGKPIERLALGGTSQGGLYHAIFAQAAIDPTTRRRPELVGQGQWDLLRSVVEERDPATIAVDISHTHAFSDGLSVGEWEELQAALPPPYLGRVVRAEDLPLDYQSIRAPGMLPTYKRLMEVVWGIIDRAFSSAVITPGKTRTDDVEWWMRQRVNDLGFGTWFQTDVDVQRRGVDLSDSASVVIQRGDVLHCDFGITALGLNTDTQHMGYVLRDGEKEVPAGLVRALANSNKLQDLLLAEMKPGRAGNEVLAAARGSMRAAGINGTIYTHPIGDRGHGAGPLIGLWDHQEGVPGRGDVQLHKNTWFAIELQATTPIPEWHDWPVISGQEEDAELGADGAMHWILRRQTEWHLVR